LDRYEHKNEEIWQTENQYEQGIMKEDLQRPKMENRQARINSELYKHAGDKFHSRLLKLFNNIYKYEYEQIPNE
jgi:hypothetical protein